MSRYIPLIFGNYDTAFCICTFIQLNCVLSILMYMMRSCPKLSVECKKGQTIEK